MKKTAYLVYIALRVAVAAMLVAYNNCENITMHTIKLRVSHRAGHAPGAAPGGARRRPMAGMITMACMLVSSDILIVLIAGGDRDGQGKDLGVHTSTDQLQPT